jgi:hypothetical protein
MIPEDFTLRRHYLTELKYKQETNFEDFISVATYGKGTKVTKLPPFAEAPVSIPMFHYVAAGFFVLLLIVLF